MSNSTNPRDDQSRLVQHVRSLLAEREAQIMAVITEPAAFNGVPVTLEFDLSKTVGKAIDMQQKGGTITADIKLTPEGEAALDAYFERLGAYPPTPAVPSSNSSTPPPGNSNA